jgi:hypothetical protein
MLDAGHDLPLCGVVGSKLIGDHHPWRSALALQELSHQAFGRLGIAATLHKNLQDEIVLINGALQPVLLASDRDPGLIEVPYVDGPLLARIL